MSDDIKRIAVFGPESTGKTLLAEKLAVKFNAPLVPEYAREFWDKHGVLTLEDMLPVAREQWRREDEAALLRQGHEGQAAPRIIVCDTDALTTMLWSDLLYGTCPGGTAPRGGESGPGTMRSIFYWIPMCLSRLTRSAVFPTRPTGKRDADLARRARTAAPAV